MREKWRAEHGEDSDGDGIPDDIDACPMEKGTKDNDGCPKLADRDGDGIPDIYDKCPDQPEDKDGIDDGDGCPETDADGDSIPDTGRRLPEATRSAQRRPERRMAARRPTRSRDRSSGFTSSRCTPQIGSATISARTASRSSRTW